MLEGFHIENGILKNYTKKEEVVLVPEGIHTIGEGAFKGCVSLKKVVLPSSLRYIGVGAFKGCRKLEEVEIKEGVSKIGDYAFHRCHSLKKMVLPFSVEELGNCVFLYCDSMEEIKMPKVRRLGKQVFLNDILLKRIMISKELEEDCICDVFTGCGNLTDISFSDGEDYVIQNAVEAIAGNQSLPSLVKVIATDVLRMMELDGRCLIRFLTNLKYVEIPEGIEKIGKSCFFDKRGILSIKFPKSLKEIESRAFRNCINLEQISFKTKQVYIHEDAFKNCTSLKEIWIENGECKEKHYELKGIVKEKLEESDKNLSDLILTIHKQVLGNFRISGTILLKYLGAESKVVIPEGITIIAERAFEGNEAIDKVVLPESIEEIGANAFRNCLLLQTVLLPEKIKRIGKGAFEHCVKLIRIKLPIEILKIERETFKNCHLLREVILEEGLKEIGEQAFYGCYSLKEILFPKTVCAIGEMAFYRCKQLKEVRLPIHINYVGNLAFSECGVRKASIDNCGKKYGIGIFSNCMQLKMLLLGENVCHIANKLAYGCTSLKRVILPTSLASVGRNVWEKTPFLEDWIQNGNELEQEIVWDGRNLEGEVIFSHKVKIIAGGAFYGNKKVTTIFVPENIKWIGEAAFKGCCELKKVVWNSKIEEIQKEVFSGCSELESINAISPKWKYIGERAFYNCKKLRKINLKDVLTFEKESFCGCTNIEQEAMLIEQKKVNLQENSLFEPFFIGERAFCGTVFENGIIGQPIVVGNIVVSAHTCSGEIYLPEGVKGIAPFAFSGNDKITKVALPESLIWIGEGAFFGCKSVSDIVFPNGYCKIEDRAFEKCISLKKVVLNTRQIGKGAFAYCIALEHIFLNGISVLKERTFEGCKALLQCICKKVKRIEAWCFSGCSALREICFEMVEYIGKFAFERCNSLKEVAFQDDIYLEAYAFLDCGRLEKVYLQGEKGTICLREYAFCGCTHLKIINVQKLGTIQEQWELHTYKDILSEKIPHIARLIFQSAFSCFEVEKEEILSAYYGCGQVVKIPNGIRKIQAEVFRNVLTLEEIEIPESVEYIGKRAFHGTTWLEKQREVSKMVIINNMLLDGACCVGEVVIPKQVSLVCGWAFANGMGIEKIRFLSEQVKVEEYAFRNCIYLKEMILANGEHIQIEGIEDREKELPTLAKQAVMDCFNCFKTNEENVLVECTGNISKLKLADGITAIGDGVFQNGNLLTEVILPFSVKKIGKGAFEGCKWLKAVYQAQGVEKIGDMAFWGCGMLEKIELSERFCQMGIRAFENCTSLKEIFIPEGVKEIPNRAFFRCHSLKQICLPSTLERIGKEAFAFCYELTKIYIIGSRKQQEIECVTMQKREDIECIAIEEKIERENGEPIVIEERAFVGCKEVKIIRS